MLTIADGGGRGGVGTPVLADVICEQPLTSALQSSKSLQSSSNIDHDDDES